MGGIVVDWSYADRRRLALGAPLLFFGVVDPLAGAK
jgi:hypothetical protein